MVIFAYKGHIDWTIGAIMRVGSVVGGANLGARLATSPAAKKYVFYLLVLVISAELVNLARACMSSLQLDSRNDSRDASLPPMSGELE